MGKATIGCIKTTKLKEKTNEAAKKGDPRRRPGGFPLKVKRLGKTGGKRGENKAKLALFFVFHSFQ